MKYRTTKKEVNAGYIDKICVGYCNIQNLLAFESPVAYTTRREGWAADIYAFGSTAIVTGYAPFGNIRPSYETCRRYEEMARKTRYNYNIKWEEQRDQLRALVDQFIEEVTLQ